MELIYAIPGLGTTKELFQNIFVPNYEIKVLDWPEPKPNYTLKEYASELITQINTKNPVTLMGVSFGGMLCSEIAEQIETKNVILISSCKDNSEFPLLLKTLKIFPAHKLFSDKMIRSLARSKRRVIGIKKSFDLLFFEMISQMPPNYFPACINYIVQWDKKSSAKKFIRIHGTADWLLPCKKSSNIHLIPQGSHIMVVNRTEEINKILNKELNGL